MSDRFIVARELAEKDGHKWETLGDIMVNAYLHNADLVIAERGRPVADLVTGKPLYTCERCQDKAYIHGKPCSECNPVGLPVEQVHPHVKHEEVGKVVSITEGEDRLDVVAELTTEGAEKLVEIGMVVEANGDEGFPINKDVPADFKIPPYTKEMSDEAKQQSRVLKPSEYQCSKCSKPGRTVIHILQKSGKGIGHKHQEFKITA